MMSNPSSNLFMYIGKPVKDEYGRYIGRIASFAVNPNGQVNSVFLEHQDGEFSRYSSDQFRIDGDNIVLTPLIKLRMKSLCDEIPLIWRKDQALNELVEKKKIPSEMFNDLHKSFEGALNQLKTDAQATLDSIDKQVANSNLQIRELNSALIHLEIEREIGRIDDKSYQTAMEMIQQGLKRTNAQKTDLETLRNQLSNLLLGENLPTQKETEKEAAPPEVPTTTPASPTLPEPPVVVHVKTATKTGT